MLLQAALSNYRSGEINHHSDQIGAVVAKMTKEHPDITPEEALWRFNYEKTSDTEPLMDRNGVWWSAVIKNASEEIAPKEVDGVEGNAGSRKLLGFRVQKSQKQFEKELWRLYLEWLNNESKKGWLDYFRNPLGRRVEKGENELNKKFAELQSREPKDLFGGETDNLNKEDSIEAGGEHKESDLLPTNRPSLLEQNFGSLHDELIDNRYWKLLDTDVYASSQEIFNRPDLVDDALARGAYFEHRDDVSLLQDPKFRPSEDRQAKGQFYLDRGYIWQFSRGLDQKQSYK